MNDHDFETVRTAAYLEALARLDAPQNRKTKSVNCNPPNVRCGNRCIPPGWDCRIKGEGSDRHLSAVKTDPLGGLANIQRGTTRLFKGITTGNFSDVEGGKRSIIRGAVKITPGDIQQKKELKAKLENNTRSIGIGLAVLTGGIGTHILFMRTNPFGYRDGIGADINNATRAGVNSILDVIPFVGAERERVRNAARTQMSNAAQRVNQELTNNPEVLQAGLGTNNVSTLHQIRTTPIAESNVAANGRLRTALRTVNDRARSTSSNQVMWDARHREAFWTQRVKASELKDKTVNIYARPATEDYIRRRYNITEAESSSTVELKAALTDRLRAEHDDYVALARQQGFRVSRSGTRLTVHIDDRRRFIRDLVTTSTRDAPLSQAARNQLTEYAENILSGNYNRYADSIYRDTLSGFDRFYTEIGSVTRSVAGSPNDQNWDRPRFLQRNERDLAEAADTMRAGYLAREMRNAHAIAGPSHAELIKIAYFNTRVAGSTDSTISITPRLAQAAVTELAGRDVSINEAERLLQTEYGFPRLTVVRSVRRRSRGDSISTEEVIPPRVASYLVTRCDLTKPA